MKFEEIVEKGKTLQNRLVGIEKKFIHIQSIAGNFNVELAEIMLNGVKLPFDKDDLSVIAELLKKKEQAMSILWKEAKDEFTAFKKSVTILEETKVAKETSTKEETEKKFKKDKEQL